MISGVRIFPPITLALSGLFLSVLSAQTTAERNETATMSAEAERRVMEETLGEILQQVGPDTERGAMFQEAQNKWVQYVKEQSKADADGVSGQATYPQSYFETMRELTRYRTRVLEGCLSRLKAEEVGVRADVAAGRPAAGAGEQKSLRDWRAEVTDEPVSVETEFYSAEIEGISGVLAGHWRGEELWRGLFFADRGDTIVFYGGKMQKGGIVFEAWQEGARIGRGYLREEEGDLRGRFYDQRRRESPLALRLLKRPSTSAGVAPTSYRGLVGTEETGLALEWHHTRLVQGKTDGGNRLVGYNYSSGKLFLEEWEAGAEGRLVGFWKLEKRKRGNSNRWVGWKGDLVGRSEKVDFGKS